VVSTVLGHLGRLAARVTASVGNLVERALGRQTDRIVQEVGAVSTEFERAAVHTIAAATPEAIAVGQAVVDAPLAAAELAVVAPEVTLPLQQVLLDFSADRIKNLSADIVGRISVELRLGALGVKPIHEVMQAIQDLLGASGPTRGIAARAEAIARTEIGRIHSLATQRRMEQALIDFPDLMKEWRHSGNRINPRDGHQAMHGTRVPVASRFRVAPTRGGTSEWMLHPRDPRASARNTVQCRCDVTPYRRSWDED
jgi:hypothetical protein